VPIAFQSVALLSLALVFHALSGHRYPRAMAAAALESRGGAPAPRAFEASPQPRVEVSDDPRGKTFDELTCEDIMCTTVTAVPATMERKAAWELLKHHRAPMLPVVDAMHRVIGMVTHHELADLRPASLSRSVRSWLQGFVRRTAIAEDTVQGLMAACTHAVHLATPLAHLVQIFIDHAHSHVPVLNDEGTLVGVVRHSDMIRWLHREAQFPRVAGNAG
jgi:CBS domain-containing membrane protein